MVLANWKCISEVFRRPSITKERHDEDIISLYRTRVSNMSPRAKMQSTDASKPTVMEQGSCGKAGGKRLSLQS